MALTSPGVEVTVIDESFYTPAEPGTTPLIVVATAQDKTNAAGTGVASATTAANAGNAFKITSQKELVDLFGVPNFEKTASNTPIHGSELNEYGLLAAYSLLGVSNAAFIVRADVDLGELSGQSEAPGANPADGTWWINTNSTTWGIQEWNSAAISTTGGEKFANKTPIVLTDTDSTKVDSTSGGKPKGSVGSIGDYAIVFETVDGTGTFSAGRETARLYYKSPGLTVAGVAAGQWVLVGSNDWAVSHATVQGATFVGGAGSFTINGTTVSVGGSDTADDVVTTINGLLAVSPAEADTKGIYAANVSGKIYLYSNAANDSVGDSTLSNSITIAAGTGTLSNYGFTAATFYGPALQQTPHTSVPQWKAGDSTPRPTGSVWIKTTEPNFGARWRASKWSTATTSWVSYEAPIYASGHASLYYLDRSGGGVNIATDVLFVQSNSDENSGYDATPATATFRVWRRAATGATAITSAVVTASTFTATTNTFTIAESLKGQLALDTAKTISFVATGATTDADLMAT